MWVQKPYNVKEVWKLQTFDDFLNQHFFGFAEFKRVFPQLNRLFKVNIYSFWNLK